MTTPIHIIGAGLAGSECAYQLATRGVPVVLHEMRPLRPTPAHQTDRCAELVCSNSFRSDDPLHAAGLLKREMEAFGSLIISAARAAAVPAGSALAVDRELYAGHVTRTLEELPHIELRREEVRSVPEHDVILATGPLTSEELAEGLQDLLGGEHLYFYDSIAPVVEAESLDHGQLFWASRYGKGEGEDYLNIPLDRQGYLEFHAAVCAADVVPLHSFERNLFFEGCLPIEEIARRGVDTLRFGPMKPVGLTAPDGSQPYAVVQLRQENLARSHFNLVGFQTRMTWTDQRRVFRTLPGLESARFVRLGQVHRNTFINSPTHLDAYYRLKRAPHVRITGQLTGVEGYLESAATGLAAALYIVLERAGEAIRPIPPTTALGALARHLTRSDPNSFQPANINFGLFTPLGRKVRKAERKAAFAERARAELAAWAGEHDLEPGPFDPSSATG